MDQYEVMRLIKRLPGFAEVYHKTSFQCYREAKDGGALEVTVVILDAGPDANQAGRYSVQARTEDGRFATGNSASTVQEALAVVHWWNLDKEP